MDNGAGRPKSRSPRGVDVSEQEWGSDLIADVLKAYGFEYVSYNPGASFRAIEESLVNYNDDTPKTIETVNEALTVSIAHGYAKATGEPSLCLLHDSVGTLNGSMSIFAAFADRVPVLVLAGNGPLRKSKRRPWIDWVHTNLDQASLVEDVVKWYDQPAHSDGVVDSIARGHRIADTPRKGPVYITLDHDVQENPLPEPIEIPHLEKLGPPAPAPPNEEALEDAADRLIDAELPVILVDQVGDSRQAVTSLVELAELLGAPVVDSYTYRPVRHNFPNTHPLNLTESGIQDEADVLLALDVWDVDYYLTDVDSATHDLTRRNPDADLIDIGIRDLEASSLITDYYRLRETEVQIQADTALAIPRLVGLVEEKLEDRGGDKETIQDRRAMLTERHAELRATWERQAADAWDETPVSLPRLTGELWDVIEDEDWVIVNGTLRGWPHRLWEIDDFDQYIGGISGGGAVGYGIGAAIGGALAYADTDRVPINLQPDGGLMQFPGGLWTISHYDIPVFTLVHNNKTLYNSTNHRMELAEYRGRDASFESALVGTGLTDPVPDYTKMAETYGVKGYGPVSDPDELPAVLDEAWSVVKGGDPVLVDVVCQAR